MTYRFFIDANVIFSMAYSATGASRELYNLANDDKVILITNSHALKEAERVIEQQYPDALSQYEEIRDSHVIEIQDALEDDVEEALGYTADPDDAPIVASAKIARAEALVSFDRKHLHTQAVSNYINAPVITSGQALAIIRSRTDE
jgi:putative PIN family toxin of toxin-antitoxin system